MNLREGHDDDLRVVLVAGDEDARGAAGQRQPVGDVAPAARPAHDRSARPGCRPAPTTGTGDPNVYTPESARSLGPDAWDPDDMLLLPLRGATGEVLGIVSSTSRSPAGGRPTTRCAR